MAADDERRDEGRPRRSARPGTGGALLWTALSVPLPGAAHLRMGRRVAGGLILGIYLLGLGALVLWAYRLGAHGSDAMTRLAGMVVQDVWLLGAMGVVFAFAVVWMSVIVHAWVITRPEGGGRGLRLAGVVTVLVLCLAVAAPSGWALHAGYTAYETLGSVFDAPEREDLPPHDAADPWYGAERVNVLLIGADSGDNRYGVRTDTMMVASLDTHTGDTVLIGLPRNLENVRFPEDTELAERYPEPYGFDLLLNDIYQTVAEEPEELALSPNAPDPSADTLKKVVGHNLDMDVEYYAMVDMMGFRDLIDAVGGVEVHITEPIPYGVHGGVLEPGVQRLNGHDALWYGRSRIGTDDYGRMGRQGCLIKYVAEQVEPTTVLTSYRRLAGATKRTLSTDIPQSKVPAFIELADQVTDEGSMSALQLSPPQVNTGNPDWEEIQELIVQAIEEAPGEGEEVPDDPSPSEGSSEEAAEDDEALTEEESQDWTEEERTEWQEYTGLDEPEPADPGRQVGAEASDLNTLCP
ncbi:LytR family transcriptional regulator [Nocardiopsis sp. MG754419]|nr:LCP family protein [Nocardiopsis sp. MG754419]MBR8741053.1 LytR family transcriptional regulator [Nocardiopsis sp. MG754419]